MTRTERQAPSRNSPCPCGSGRRYKDCHGALGREVETAPSPGTARSADAVTMSVAPRSSYRAPDTEWEHLGEADRERIGGMMEAALALQTAHRLDAAIATYRKVLAEAPRTHDALHMLGVALLMRGDPIEAERAILAALELRPEYPTILHNLGLAREAAIASLPDLPERLCEHALPLLADLALAPAAARQGAHPGSRQGAVHLIGRLHAGDDDDAWLLGRLAMILAPLQPTLWATDGANPAGPDLRRSGTIDTPAGAYPRVGTHVFVGMEHGDLEWLERADADRVIVFCTAAPPSRCLQQLRAIALDGARPVELVVSTGATLDRFGGFGRVLPLPLTLPDPSSDAARDRPPRAPVVEPHAAWAVGVDGGGGSTESSAATRTLLAALAARAGTMVVHRPGFLRHAFGADPAFRFAQDGPGSLVAFLRSIDAYVHRWAPWWREGDERTLLTAMALGVPVLCPRASRFAELIVDRVDGLLYEAEDETPARIAELRAAPELARAIGAAARAKVRARYAPEVLAAEHLDYFRGGAPSVATRVA